MLFFRVLLKFLELSFFVPILILDSIQFHFITAKTDLLLITQHNPDIHTFVQSNCFAVILNGE